MRIVSLSIDRFRGIHSLRWIPPRGVLCLLGPGDSGKTTILEALELVLFPQAWIQFLDSDFYGGATEEPIEIEATIVDLPAQLLTQEKFGLEQRGWSEEDGIHDEPADDDTPALTIRLRVDDSLDPSWRVVNDRIPDGRAIGPRDRERLAAVRLGDNVDRQLSWVRGSSLVRVTDSPDTITVVLAEAHRNARDAVAAVDFAQLSATAAQAGEWGTRYGANLDLPLGVGVDPRQLNVGSGSLNLRQANGIPARAAGLGSRRLLGLAIQRQSVATSVVVLVDEVEQGLEPHRLRHLLRELQESGHQVLLTSHSETAVAELGVRGLVLVRQDADGDLQILHPDPALQSVIRALPEAVLARKIVVCEGSTEYGIARALVAHWDSSRERPLASLGTVFVPGGGSQAPQRAAAFRELGFECVYWGDSDVVTSPSISDLEALGVTPVVWGDEQNTEQRIMSDVPEPTLERLWAIAADERGEDVISNQLAALLGIETPPQN